MRRIINGTIALIAKFQRIPDLSTICDNLQVIQSHAKAADKETKESLSKIREDIKGNSVKRRRPSKSRKR